MLGSRPKGVTKDTICRPIENEPAGSFLGSTTKLAKVKATGAVLTRVQQQRLVKDVRALLEAGRAEAQQAVDRVALQTYWQVGRRVLREELAERAGYGTAVLAEIATEVGVDQRTLQHAVLLARLYAEAPSAALNWSQYRSTGS